MDKPLANVYIYQSQLIDIYNYLKFICSICSNLQNGISILDIGVFVCLYILVCSGLSAPQLRIRPRPCLISGVRAKCMYVYILDF